MKTTRFIWLSEDATAVVSKVTYDPSTNQLIGLLLPTDENTGCPKPFSFSAGDAETIKSHLLTERSTTVYLVMAQPLDEEVPPFILQMFGSNNRFDSQDVIRRWKHTEAELEKYKFQFV